MSSDAVHYGDQDRGEATMLTLGVTEPATLHHRAGYAAVGYKQINHPKYNSSGYFYSL